MSAVTLRRGVLWALFLVTVAGLHARELRSQELPGRERPTMTMPGPSSVTPPPVQRLAGPRGATRPAWVEGNVPDTVWLLVEASVAEPDAERSKAMLTRAEALAREAVIGHEDDVGRRFALAVVLGMRTDVEGGKTKVRVASGLYDELAEVLRLDPEHARARHLMGRLHAGVRRMNGITRWVATNLLGGDRLAEASWGEAERHLSFAEARAPEVPDHHLQLAKLYLDTGRRGAALQEARHVLEMAVASPLERAALEEARGMVRALADSETSPPVSTKGVGTDATVPVARDEGMKR